VLGRSRDRKAPEFVGLVEHIYSLDDRASGAAIDRGCAADAGVGSPAARKRGRVVGPGRDHGPPRLSVAELADELYLEVDDLLPLIDALELLELAQVEAGQMELTPEGQTFAGADIQASKEMFAAAALALAPLVRALFNGLERAGDHTLRIGFFRDVLRRAFSEAETDPQLDVALDWGRYAALRQPPTAALKGPLGGTPRQRRRPVSGREGLPELRADPCGGSLMTTACP